MEKRAVGNRVADDKLPARCLYLKMIFLLAHERVVRVAEIESLVRVYAVMRHWQLFQIVVAENVPGRLLKGVKPDALVACIDVAVVGDLVAVEDCAAAAATVLHRSQFRFLWHNNRLTTIDFTIWK